MKGWSLEEEEQERRGANPCRLRLDATLEPCLLYLPALRTQDTGKGWAWGLQPRLPLVAVSGLPELRVKWGAAARSTASLWGPRGLCLAPAESPRVRSLCL